MDMCRCIRSFMYVGATVAERLARSPPTKANRVQSLAGSPDFRKWESSRTMPLVVGFSRGSPPFPPAPSFRCRSIFTSITLICSQDLAVKSHQNQSLTHSLNVSVLYMKAVVMCMQYWPASKELSETHGGINISIAREEELANFHIRTFRLAKMEEGALTSVCVLQTVETERKILQFHYTQWHSHTCPFSNAILEFRRRVRAVVGTVQSDLSGPMIVHCNDGGGRSGVYLAIDANLELMEEEDAFDVFGYFKKLRQSRKGLIETLDQYKFVYDTLEEFVICGTSWFPVKELSQRLKQKSVKNSVSKINEYQHEYNLICKQTPRFTIGDCAGGHRADNREKNRDVLVVPPDNARPYLISFQGNNFTDYINAVFVD
ncbi:hypothetical protein PR048_020653, partial [Dryococelus australis]